MATDLVVNIASQFLGRKAFLDADKATKKLTGSVKNLGRTLGVSLSAAAVLAYGKASVKAASEDIKAQKLLANSLKNVGLAYATVDAEDFISKMQSQTGVLDDQLRPAFAKLASVTGSVTKTEKLLALAFDVSSGSSLDYASAVDVLSQAYVGNNKGLKQLDLGLTQAEIKAMSFDDVMTLLNERFAGSGKAALNTYVGQMSLLSAASSNASEIIGVSLLGAIDSLTGSDGIADLGEDIENAAKSLANFIDSIVYLKAQIATIPGAGIVSSAFGAIGNLLGRFSPQRAAELLKQIKGPQPFTTPMTISNQSTGTANAAARKKAEQDAIKRNKELALLAKKQADSALATAKAKKLSLAIDSANLVLGKGENAFDMDKIQVNAALISQAEQLGKATTGAQVLAIANDVQRLRVKESISALEDAIAAKDEAAIKKATAKLNEDLKILGALQNQEAKLLDINNILAGMKSTDLISLTNLNNALALLAKFQFPTLTVPTATAIAGTNYNPTQALDLNYDLKNPLAVFVTNMAATTGNGTIPGAGTIYNPSQNPDRNYDNYNITINAGVIAAPEAFVDIVQNALNEIARRGNSTTYAGAIAG